MGYQVRCECGKSRTVSAADAGASFPCACGRTVEVPPLHQLRTAAGESPLPLLAQVRLLIQNGQLPGTTHCARCSQPTKGMMRFGLGCEPTPGPVRGASNPEAGCLLFVLFGPLYGPLFKHFVSRSVQAESPDVSLVAPLPVCEACRPALDDPGELRKALRTVPEYAALLDQYPGTRITRFG